MTNKKSLKLADNVPKVSIIIPCRYIDGYTMECIYKCLNCLDYDDIEVIVLPDRYNNVPIKNKKLKIISTGEKPPGAKRNIGIENSSGDVIAFIDSDAYPARDWLKNAIRYLEDREVVAVGGPGVTPEEDALLQKASGYVYSSFLMGGLSRRFKQDSSYESDDVHSCNFIVKRDALDNIRWDERYWPGEDTLICKDLKRAGKILEAKDVVVYHHRKPLFIPHLKQVYNFGIHRGLFARKFGENSLKLVYFLPSVFVLYLLFGTVTSVFFEWFKKIFLLSLAFYLITTLISSLNSRKLFLFVFIGIILTHITYGIAFLFGLAKKDLRRWL